jgi:tRNA (adenine22-N1)-methyltransferase
MQLSKRLQRIADYIRPGDRIIDVGTDHAYIPILLLLKYPDTKAVATDIRSGPLNRARLDAEYYHVADRLELRQCHGLSFCEPDSVDTVIIAGMGGETIIGILSDALWTRQKRLIVQPQTKQDELRAWLGSHGYQISDASLAYDTGRIYLIWLIEEGNMPQFHGVDNALLMHRDPLLRPYLDDQIKRIRKRLHGIEASANPDEKILKTLQDRLSELESIYKEVSAWQP